MPNDSPHPAGELNLRQTLLRGLAGVGAARAAQMGMALVVSVLLARALGPEDFGRYSLVIAVLGLCALPAYAGPALLLVREVARYDLATESPAKWRTMGALWAWTLRLTILLALVGAVVYVSFFSFDQPLVVVVGLALAVIATALTRTSAALLQGMRRVVVATLPDTLVRPVVMLLLLGVLLLTGTLNMSNALLCYCAAVLCASGYAGLLVRTLRSRFVGSVASSEASNNPQAADLPAQVSRWRAAVGPFTGIAVIGYLNIELLVPLVALLADPVEVAYFRIALSLAMLIGMPLILIESVIKPTVTHLYESGEGPRLRRLINRAGWGALGLCLPVLGGFVVFGERLISLVYGGAYVAATLPMIVLCVGFAVVNLIGPSMQLLYATRFEKDALVISLLSLLAIVLCSVALIPSYGALGGAIAIAIARIFRALAFRIWASRRLHSLFHPETAA